MRDFFFRVCPISDPATYVITAPGIEVRGQVCDVPVDLMSIYPTLLQLSGLPQRNDIDGVSVVPLLEDCAADWTVPALTTNERNNHAVRSGDWSYIRYANGDEELYNRADDPWELHNLAGDPSTAELREDLAASLPCPRYPLIGTLGCDDPEVN